jgi:hypothetical protein
VAVQLLWGNVMLLVCAHLTDSRTCSTIERARAAGPDPEFAEL